MIYNQSQVVKGSTTQALTVLAVAQATSDIALVTAALAPMDNGYTPTHVSVATLLVQTGLPEHRIRAACWMLQSLGVIEVSTKVGNGGGQFYRWIALTNRERRERNAA